MSDGISKLLGRETITRELEGVELTFSVGVLADRAEKEQFILSLQPDPLEVLSRLPDDIPKAARAEATQQAIALACRPQFVPRNIEAQFDDSLTGLAWALWRALRDNHPEFGKCVNLANAKYEAPNGRGYSMGPREGIQMALDLIEAVGNEHLGTLMRIRDGVNQERELKN